MRCDATIHRLANYLDVYLDGEKLSDCKIADDCEGWAEVYILNERGRRTLQTRMLRGKVEFKLIERERREL